MNQISKVLEEAVIAFSSLPGIGRKTALRLALHMAKQDANKTIQFAESIQNISSRLKTCSQCFAYSDDDVCSICLNPKRDQHVVCVIESVRDLFALEETQTYKGRYHVLGGLISPIDGIGPDQLTIQALFDRISKDGIEEIIMAIRPTIEGDTTAYYIHKNIPVSNVRMTMIARGVSFGSELEYADELTLTRSMVNRTPYQIHDNTTG